MAGIQVIPRQPVGGQYQTLQNTLLQEELGKWGQHKQQAFQQERLGQFLSRAAGSSTKSQAFTLLGEYSDLFAEPNALNAGIKAIDTMFPETGPPVEVTAYNVHGDSKTFHLPRSEMSKLEDPAYVQRVFGPDYTMVKPGTSGKEDLINYFNVKPSEQATVSPEASYIGRFRPNEAPPGAVAEPELKTRQQRADDLRGQEALSVSEARLRVMENLITANKTVEQVRMMNEGLNIASKEIDKFMELDSVLSVLKDQRKTKERAMEIATELINKGTDAHTAARVAGQQTRKEIESGATPETPEAPKNPLGGTYQLLKPQTGKPKVEPAKPSGKVTPPPAKAAPVQGGLKTQPKAEKVPTQEYIDYLRAHPETAESFDKAFGKGSAARYLKK